jgi:hypothetical protein
MFPIYAIERNPKFYIYDLIIDTENAISHLYNNIQNTFRHLAAKRSNKLRHPIDTTPCAKDITTM